MLGPRWGRSEGIPTKGTGTKFMQFRLSQVLGEAPMIIRIQGCVQVMPSKPINWVAEGFVLRGFEPIRGPIGLSKDRNLELWWFLMHPRCLHRISEVGGEEGLRVVSQRAIATMWEIAYRAENRELFAKEADRTVIAVSSAKAKIGIGLLVSTVVVSLSRRRILNILKSSS